MKHLIPVFFFLLPVVSAYPQTSDDAYKLPLKEVLQQIEARFRIKIKYTEAQVQNREVRYAQWRFRQNLQSTITNVLTPLDLKLNKENDSTYKLKEYEYHRRTYEEGREHLAYLSSFYHNAQEWDKRKKDIRPCLYQALKLSPLPPAPSSKPIITNPRKMNGYTVENIALEVLPGVYVCGSLYRPSGYKGKIPVVLNPDGHWAKQRYRPDCQLRCAALAKMGAMAFSYDMFAWGESLLQFKEADHRQSLAMTVQVLSSIRILDYLLSREDADTARVAITGGSGGGSQTVLIAAMDERIRLSVPVVSLSSYFYGGCPCESGMPVHFCGGGTNNVELAAMAAPSPQLVISDGQDWTDHMPDNDFPYLMKVYDYYGKAGNVQNTHLPAEGHDYGLSKRTAMYRFMAAYFNLNISVIQNSNGQIDESGCTVEKESALYVFGGHGQDLPANAIKGFGMLEEIINKGLK